MFLSLLVRGLGSRVVYDMDSSLPEQLLGKYGALRALDGAAAAPRAARDRALRSRHGRLRGPRDARTRLRDGDTRRRRRGRLAARRRAAPTATSRTCAASCRTAPCSLCTSVISSTTRASTCCSTRSPSSSQPPLKFVAIGGSAESVAAYRARAESLGLGAGRDVRGRAARRPARRLSRAGGRARLAAALRSQHADEALLVSRGRQARARDAYPLAHAGAVGRQRTARRADCRRRSRAASTP